MAFAGQALVASWKIVGGTDDLQGCRLAE